MYQSKKEVSWWVECDVCVKDGTSQLLQAENKIKLSLL
jgi:hypothetical protein